MEGKEYYIFELTHRPKRWILLSGRGTLAKSMSPCHKHRKEHLSNLMYVVSKK
jgi:hypothetical protein